MRRLFHALFFLAILFVIAAVASVGVIVLFTGQSPLETARDISRQFILSRRSDDLTTPISTSDQAVRFVVESGTGPAQIAFRLVENGLIADADLFVTYAAATNIDTQLEAGTYFLAPNMPLVEIAQRLTDSNSSQIIFRILEGWRAEEIADAIDRNGLFGFTGADFLSVVGPGGDIPPEFTMYVQLPEGRSLEGFLYPDTYQLPPGITPTGLRDILLETFRENVSVDLYNEAQQQNITLYEAVTLASIAEREAVHPEEHPQIMSVYRNRLNIGMRLDADPTIQYALGNTRGGWWAQITRQDYTDVVSPYNTYLTGGLPPGPISNPGIAAIRAAINPAQTEFLYFRAVCDNSGYHEFAVTYEEHLLNGCTG